MLLKSFVAFVFCSVKVKHVVMIFFHLKTKFIRKWDILGFIKTQTSMWRRSLVDAVSFCEWWFYKGLQNLTTTLIYFSPSAIQVDAGKHFFIWSSQPVVNCKPSNHPRLLWQVAPKLKLKGTLMLKFIYIRYDCWNRHSEGKSNCPFVVWKPAANVGLLLLHLCLWMCCSICLTLWQILSTFS